MHIGMQIGLHRPTHAQDFTKVRIPLYSVEENTDDICMKRYAMGRRCGCISKLKWVEQFKYADLVCKYEL